MVSSQRCEQNHGSHPRAALQPNMVCLVATHQMMRDVRRIMSMFNKIFGIGLVFWLISMIISFSLLGLLIYVARHFILKFW